MELVSRLFAGLLVGGLVAGVMIVAPVDATHGPVHPDPASPVDCSRRDLSPSEAALCGVRTTDPGAGPGSSQKIGDVIQGVVKVLSWAIGVIAVIVILVQGLRLVISGGNTNTANSVRNGIIFAGAGLVIAVLAPHIVGFFVGLAS